MAEQTGKRTWGDWFLIAFGSVLGLIFFFKLLGNMGLIADPFPHVEQAPARARFDNANCLQRNAMRVRGNDPMISDNDVNGIVARACVVEREEFEGR